MPAPSVAMQEILQKSSKDNDNLYVGGRRYGPPSA
jgi:hypothetical protein